MNSSTYNDAVISYQDERLIRADRDIITSIIPKGSHVLDLGCGDGSLLMQLTEEKEVIGRGVEIEEQNLIRCLEKSLSVCMFDLDRGLSVYPDKSYDFVVLNQTLQVVKKPLDIIKDILRVGHYGIVGFPNFGNWLIRARLFFGGAMPHNSAMPFTWYDTPNIHHMTVKDFKRFCISEKITIIREEYYMLGKWRCSPIVNPLANLFALNGMFVLEKQ